ncbi:MAG: ribbon-helix-helix protein, CopG family [Elusimicrobia bacterium]|nr:ribbon-helix-helix protein, CopG family [Elusimicrobiota bacterium]
MSHYTQMVRRGVPPRAKAVQIRMTEEEVKTLRVLAKKEQRSISNYVRWLVEKEAKKS